MTEDLIITVMTDVFFTTMTVLLPILGVSLVIGIFISIFQAATSIQEMTLTFVPKIIATSITIIVLLPWILDKMTGLLRKMIDIYPTVIK